MSKNRLQLIDIKWFFYHFIQVILHLLLVTYGCEFFCIIWINSNLTTNGNSSFKIFTTYARKIEQLQKFKMKISIFKINNETSQTFNQLAKTTHFRTVSQRTPTTVTRQNGQDERGQNAATSNMEDDHIKRNGSGQPGTHTRHIRRCGAHSSHHSNHLQVQRIQTMARRAPARGHANMATRIPRRWIETFRESTCTCAWCCYVQFFWAVVAIWRPVFGATRMWCVDFCRYDTFGVDGVCLNVSSDNEFWINLILKICGGFFVLFWCCWI